MEAKVTALKAEIEAHVHSLDCGPEFERFGAMRRLHCTLRWRDGAKSKLDRAEYVLARSEGHHCQPHRCDFGPNCASYQREAV